MLKVGPYTIGNSEPREVRKEAAVKSVLCVVGLSHWSLLLPYRWEGRVKCGRTAFLKIVSLNTIS